MSSATYRELVTLASRVKSDAIALLEALYHSHPELWPSTEVGSKRWNQTDIKVIDDNGMSHDHLGRFDGGSGGFSFGVERYHFPPDGVLAGRQLSSWKEKNRFDSLHRWSGPELPEFQSPAFQTAKTQGLSVILPYARNVYQEAGVAVIRKDNRLHGFTTGQPNSVHVMTPFHESFALLHTHSYEGPHSEQDWVQFITSAQTLESHVITPTTTYSLHKPPGWRAEDYGFETRSLTDNQEQVQLKGAPIFNEYLNLHNRAIDLIGGDLSEGWEARACEIINRRLAERYGIIFRIGKREERLEQIGFKGAFMEHQNEKQPLIDENYPDSELVDAFGGPRFSYSEALNQKIRQHAEELKASGKPLILEPAIYQKFRAEVEEEGKAWKQIHFGQTDPRP